MGDEGEEEGNEKGSGGELALDVCFEEGVGGRRFLGEE